MIPTEPIGSLPRPQHLIDALATTDANNPVLDQLYDDAVRNSIEQLEATAAARKLQFEGCLNTRVLASGNKNQAKPRVENSVFHSAHC